MAKVRLVTEDAPNMTWMLDTFKQRNSNWQKTRVVMSDKDIGERAVIKIYQVFLY